MMELIVFALAFAASAAPPGPDTMTVFGRGLAGGLRAAAPFALGVTGAKLALLTLAVYGLAEVAQRFAPLFTTIKWAGAAYLVFIGLRVVVRPRAGHEIAVARRSSGRDLLAGFGLGISNPNAVVFYVALVPNVVDLAELTAVTYLSLVTIVVTIWWSVAVAYGGLAGRLANRLTSRRAQRRLQRSAGATMVGAGVLVATR